MSRSDVDDFLSRSAEVLDAPVPTACAWCTHPLDETSPSGDFCGQDCAAYWRAGLDWTPEEKCGCRVCDPEWHARYPSRRVSDADWQAAYDRDLAASRGVSPEEYDAVRAHAVSRTVSREVFRTRPDMSRAERSLAEIQGQIDESMRASSGTGVHQVAEMWLSDHSADLSPASVETWTNAYDDLDPADRGWEGFDDVLGASATFVMDRPVTWSGNPHRRGRRRRGGRR